MRTSICGCAPSPTRAAVELAVTGWTARPARGARARARRRAPGGFPARRRRLDVGDRRGACASPPCRPPPPPRPAGRRPSWSASQLTRLFRLEEGEEGELPLLTALAEQRRFDGQLAELRGGRGGRYRLAGIPLIDGAGRFAGFRGSAAGASGRRRRVVAAAAGAAPGAGRLRRAARQGAAGAARPDHRQRRDDRRPGRGADPHRIMPAMPATSPPPARHLLALVDDLVDLQAIERPDFRAGGRGDRPRRRRPPRRRPARGPRRRARRSGSTPPPPARACPPPATSAARCRSSSTCSPTPSAIRPRAARCGSAPTARATSPP